MKQSRIGWVLALAVGVGTACDSASGIGGAGGASGMGAGIGGTTAAGTSGGAGVAGTTSGAGGSGVPTVTPKTCADLTCAAPATCDDSAGDAECFCPTGFADLQGDGSLCEDIDECDEGTDDCDDTKTCENTEGGFDCSGENECAKDTLNDCDANATCADTAAGYDCDCDAPWEGDGKDCDCPSGHTKADGKCLADDGTACEDDINCLNDHCVLGICCAQACDNPALCETTNGATCSDGATCVYPTSPNGEACAGDLNPCTVDLCQGGICDTATPKTCGDSEVCTDDTCDSADVTGDPCRFTPNTAACDDGNPCTVSDVCSNTFCDGSVRNCDDGNICKTDACNPSDFDGDPCTHTNNAAACDDGSVCTGVGASGVDTCGGGACVPGATRTCNDNNLCTNDSCHPTLGCQVSNNTAPCSDDDACTGTGATGVDACAGGACQPGVTRDCDDANLCKTDTCNPADTDGDPCVHTNNTVACNDSNACTTPDACAGGSCAGGPPNACEPNAMSCTPVTPTTRTCSCDVGYTDPGNGTCVPNTNQCTNPGVCSTLATCLDPTPGGGTTETCDTLCTCGAGYTGTGCPAACADVNECTAGNPCGEDSGRGTCNNTAGAYTCSCGVGFMQVDGASGPTCVCDMNGTFAIRIQSDVSWMNIENVQNGSATTYSWALRSHSYMPDGTLEVETTPCGGTAPDICGTGFSNACATLGAEAYAQFLPNQIWGIPGMPTELLTMNLLNALPGQAFVTPQTAVLLGISLTNPLDVTANGWPAANNNVQGGGGTRTNGAAWVNHDGDSFAAVTIYAVPPGGIGTGGNPAPPFAFNATSSACGGLSYAWWPGLDDGIICPTVRKVVRFYAASRAVSYLSGSITSCDLITGDVAGPDPDASDPGSLGEMHSDARFQGCARCSSGSAANCTPTACSNTLTDFYDNTPQAQKLNDASFIIKRVAGDTTCADARALTFP